MAPPRVFPSLQQAILRAHPMRAATMMSMQHLESADADVVTGFQERRLRALVRWAAVASPFYRDWFRRNGVDPRAIRTLDDLGSLPLIERSALVAHPERFRAYPSRLMWQAHSSGTSGRAVTVYRTPGSSIYEACALDRQRRWYGLPAGMRRITLGNSDFAADHPDDPVESVPGARQLLISSYHLTPTTLPTIMSAVRAFRPDVVDGWPSSIAVLAALLHDRGERLPLRAILTSSEMMRDDQRALMRHVFGGPIVDHYGQTERAAFAATCEKGSYHLFPDYGIVETIPVPGVPDRWEIVGTPLHNWGFPVLRYRTGDRVGPAPAGPCECGRTFPRLGSLDGRVEDRFVTADGRPLPLPSIVLDDVTGVREIQIAQRAPGRFEVRVAPGAGYDAAHVENTLRRNVDRYFGPGQDLTIVAVGAVPRTAAGKLRTAVVEDDLREPMDLSSS
ncbi:phenylacetate--CoA ligase family protein [Rhodococcus sp. (in: high G+C Gram-positive bacteria)]|uniref:phenylacetate--CoA ligase family protein n=1 Tax=Rhodococcus sp. TaxID=1831 RepID=UPI00388F316F